MKFVTWIWQDERNDWRFSRTVLILTLVFFAWFGLMIHLMISDSMSVYQESIVDKLFTALIALFGFYLGKRVNETAGQKNNRNALLQDYLTRKRPSATAPLDETKSEETKL